MKDKILNLRSQGLTYSQIVKELGCSKSTVAYHCNDTTREKRKVRKTSKLSKLSKRLNTHRMSSSVSFFSRRSGEKTSFHTKDVLDKFGENTVCYLTGTPINLLNSNYHLDHIIPVCKGGDNTINNLGILCPEVNQAKGGLLVEEFLDLCKKVLQYNGYTVTK